MGFRSEIREFKVVYSVLVRVLFAILPLIFLFKNLEVKVFIKTIFFDIELL